MGFIKKFLLFCFPNDEGKLSIILDELLVMFKKLFVLKFVLINFLGSLSKSKALMDIFLANANFGSKVTLLLFIFIILV